MPDLAQPNYQTVDAQGRTGANFPGHVAAAGIDFVAGTTSSPSDDRRLRWLRQPDGAVVADVFGYETPPGGGVNGADQLTVNAHGNASNDATVALQALAGADAAGDPLTASLLATMRADGTYAITTAFPGSFKTIIDNTGASHFAQLSSARRWIDYDFHVINVSLPAGFFNQIGTIPVPALGTGFVVLGSLYDTNSLVACTWSYGTVSAGQIPIFMRNPLTVTATGAWVGFVRGFG